MSSVINIPHLHQLYPVPGAPEIALLKTLQSVPPTRTFQRPLDRPGAGGGGEQTLGSLTLRKHFDNRVNLSDKVTYQYSMLYLHRLENDNYRQSSYHARLQVPAHPL